MYTEEQIGTLTFTGDPARFVATERVPIAPISMDFEPVQDLHGYEYPWSAGGGVNVADVHCEPFVSAGVTISANNNIISISGTKSGGSYKDIPFTLNAGTYYVSAFIIGGTVSSGQPGIYIFDGSSNLTATLYETERSFTIESDAQLYVRLALWKDNATYTNYQIGVVVSKTANIATFAPYNNICPITGRDSVTVYVSPEPRIVDGTEEHEIEFGQTVYAGTLTINEDGTGTIVATMAKAVLDGTINPIYPNWRPTETSSAWLYSTNDFSTKAPSTATDMPNFLCDRLRTITYNQLYAGTIENSASIVSVGSNYSIGVRVTGTSLRTTFKINEYLSNNPIEVVYELADPVTIQLDPIEIITLIGMNYVWTDEHNLITISFPYRKEIQPMALNYDFCWTYPKAYIDKLEARIAALETAAEAAAAEANTAAAPAVTKETVEPEIIETDVKRRETTEQGGD